MQTTEHNAVTSTSILKEHSYSIVSYEIGHCFNELQKQWHELYSCNIPGEHLSNYAYYLLSNSLLLPYAVREEFLSAHHVLKRYCTTKNKSLAKETYTKILKLYLRVTHNETLFGHNYLKELQSLWSCFFPKPLGPMRGEQIVIAARYIISANLLPNEEIEKIRSEYVCLAGNESENERGTSEVTTAQNKQVELVINTETAVAGTKVVDNKSPIKIALDTDTVEGETSSVPVVDSSSHQSNVTTFVQTQTNAENLAKNGMKTEADENELPSLVIAMDHHPSHSSTAETCAINGTISENVNNNKSVVQSRKGNVGAVKKKSRFRLTRKKGWTKTRKQMPLIQKVSGEVNDKSSEIRNAVANEITTMLIEKTGHGSKLEQELWDDSVFHTTFIRPRKSTTCKPIGKEVTELPCKDVRLGHPNPKEQIREECSVAPVPDIITENLPVDGVEEEVLLNVNTRHFSVNNVPDLENEDGTHNQIVAVLDYYPLESEPAILESCGINTRELSQEVTSNVNQCTIGNDKVVAATDKQISISQSAKAPTAQEKPLPGFSQSESDKCATLTRTTTELAEVGSSSCQSNVNEQDAILTEQSAELRVSRVQKYKFKKIHQSSTTGRAKRITYYDERNRKYIEKNSDFGDLSEEEYDLSKPPTTCPTIKESIKNVELVTIYVDSILNGGASTHEICSQILEHRYLEIFGHKKSGQYLINRVNYVLKHKRLPLKTLTAIWDTTRVRNKIRNVVLKLENISIPTGVKIELINRVIVEAPGCTILHHKIKKHNELKQRLGGDHRSPSKASTVSVNDSGYTNTNPRETSDGVIAVPPDAENDFVDIVLSVKHPSLSQTNIYKVITEVWERNKKQAIAVPQSQINVSKTEPKVEDASSSRNNTEIREEHKNVDVSVPPLFYSPCNTHNVTRGITESVPNTIISNASTREFLFETPSKEIVKDANIIEPVKYTSRIPVEAITIHDEIRNKSPTNKSKDVNKSIVELITNVPEDEVVNNSETENSSRLELSIANSPDKPNLKINEIVSGDNSRFSTTNPKDVDKPVIFPKEIPGLRKDVVDVVNKSEMEESACLQLSSACSPNKPKPKINETVVGNESQSSTNQTKDADKPLVLPRKVRELRKSVVDDFEVINKSEIGKSSQLQLGSASSPNLIINNALDRNRSQCSTNNRKDVGKPITLPRKVRELRRSVVDEVEVVNKSEIGKSSQLQLSSASSSNMPNPKINKVVGGNESQSSANNSSGVLPSKVRKLRKNVVDGVGKINKSEMGNSCKLQQDSASSPNIPNSKTSEAAGINKAQYSTNNLKDVDQPIILPRTEVRKNVVDEVKVVNKCEMGKSSELQPDNTNSLSKAIPKISESVGRNKSQSSIDNPKDLKESMILPIKIRRIRKNLFEVEVVNKSEIEKSSQLQLDSVTSPDKPNLEVPKKKKLRRRSKSVALTKASLLKDNEVDEASNSPVKATTTNKELEIGNDCPSLVPINDISNSSLAAKKSLQKASIKKLSKPVPVVQSLVNNVCKRKRKSAEAHENKIDVTDRLQTPAVAKKLSKPVPVVQTSVNNVCKRKRKSAEAHENKIDVTDRLQTPAVAKPLLWILEPPPLIPISNKWKPEVSRFEPKWKTVTSTVTNVNSDDIAKEITGITVSPCTMGPLKNVQASDDVVDCGEKFITALSNSVASKANESDLEIVDINNTRKDEIEPIKTNDKAASGIVIKKNERKKGVVFVQVPEKLVSGFPPKLVWGMDVKVQIH
ncbi:hypothetical protein NQ315_002990 [Exocentrus adspersus]|uniref:Uncharacterized protein n=1 Tax=Exocentrus adspersus TaxID=1586481 RepID=A0AAV8W4V6_9CUCU|nr:hypothetical protein NQ315_002990 [Exocentrus adspersus]